MKKISKVIVNYKNSNFVFNSFKKNKDKIDNKHFLVKKMQKIMKKDNITKENI